MTLDNMIGYIKIPYQRLFFFFLILMSCSLSKKELQIDSNDLISYNISIDSLNNIVVKMSNISRFTVEVNHPYSEFIPLLVYNSEKEFVEERWNIILYDYRINYIFTSHFTDTELVTTLSNTELKYFLLNL